MMYSDIILISGKGFLLQKKTMHLPFIFVVLLDITEKNSKAQQLFYTILVIYTCS